MRLLPLQTPRLRLRPFTADDLPHFTAYRSHPDVARYQSWSDYSAADAQAFFAQQRRLEFNRDDSWFQLAVERREDGALLGDIAVHFFDEGRQAELGVTQPPASRAGARGAERRHRPAVRAAGEAPYYCGGGRA